MPRHKTRFFTLGDVGIHTRMALEALAEMPAFRALTVGDRAIVFSAVLLHDIGKIAATRVESDGRVSSRGHSAIGESQARVELWRQAMPLASRESVAALVRNHQLPFFLVELRRRNQQRERKLPWTVIENLLEKWSVPDRTEAHQVDLPESQ